MAFTKEDISNCFDRGVTQKATHMLIVCDTYDWEDYPVYVMPGEDVLAIYKEHMGPNMQKVMEVYNLKQPKEKQLNQVRCLNF